MLLIRTHAISVESSSATTTTTLVSSKGGTTAAATAAGVAAQISLISCLRFCTRSLTGCLCVRPFVCAHLSSSSTAVKSYQTTGRWSEQTNARRVAALHSSKQQQTQQQPLIKRRNARPQF
ncbi:unnamed protein product [Ceratitis capitata]|uniref:(Mediterranean fruit fly) hypothetical protein n=1 Tax=Ceratitis capitata TaxID=7213 RepID=A0A811ULX0_CERCA|nr:unnamed protein product [Ceratitis capitata]